VANLEEIDRARRLLGLGNAATLKDIKRAYRLKAFKHHPDRAVSEQQDSEMMKQLNWAYKLLIEYCNNYSYTFNQDDIARTYPYDEYLRRYSYGWFDGI
jgi:DnaJ-class molecular chaperone